MTQISFDDFCAAACAHVAPHVPERTTTTDVSTISVSLAGLPVKVLHFPHVNPNQVIVMLNFGVPAPGQDMQTIMAMMTANFGLMAQRDGAAYCRNPLTGEILLQYAVALDAASAANVLARASDIAQCATGECEQLSEWLAREGSVLLKTTSDRT